MYYVKIMILLFSQWANWILLTAGLPFSVHGSFDLMHLSHKWFSQSQVLTCGNSPARKTGVAGDISLSQLRARGSDPVAQWNRLGTPHLSKQRLLCYGASFPETKFGGGSIHSKVNEDHLYWLRKQGLVMNLKAPQVRHSNTGLHVWGKWTRF